MPFGEEFRSAYGQGTQYRMFQPADRSRLEATVPGFLLDLWETDGWAGYRGGLLWTLDPQDLDPVVAAWNVPKQALVPVARTAFGKLFLLHAAVAPNGSEVREVVGIDPHRGTYSTLAGIAERFFSKVLAKDSYIQASLMEPETQRAAKDLGPLAWNEMYAYEPALALGGSGKPETVRKVDLINHHLLLSQLAPIKLQRL
jgi:hypothetical protein